MTDQRDEPAEQAVLPGTEAGLFCVEGEAGEDHGDTADGDDDDHEQVREGVVTQVLSRFFGEEGVPADFVDQFLPKAGAEYRQLEQFLGMLVAYQCPIQATDKGDGEHVADMTSGYLRKVYTCDCCHDRVDSEDSLVYSEWSDVNLCSFCRDSDYRYALVANYVHDYIPHSEAVYVHGEDCYFSMNYADSCDHIKYYEPTDEWMTEEHYEMYHQENEPEVEAA